MNYILSFLLRNGPGQLDFTGQQRNRIQHAHRCILPSHLHSQVIDLVRLDSWNIAHNLNNRFLLINPNGDRASQCGHGYFGRKGRCQFQLAGDVNHIVTAAAKINILAGEGNMLLQFRFGFQIAFSPIIDGLPTDQGIVLPLWIADGKYPGKLLESKSCAHRSGPFCKGTSDLPPVGNFPFNATRHRNPTLLSGSFGSAPAGLHHGTGLGFHLLDGAVTAFFHC